MNDYIQSIIARVEPEIMESLDEILRACPSAHMVATRGYSHQIKLKDLNEIEQVNLLYRKCDQLCKDGEPYEVDHKVPLFKGGAHSLSNLQILTKAEHKAKNREDRKGADLSKSTRRK